jgi:hypothetical protein
VTYVSVPITARLVAISSRHIISRIGTYYSVPVIRFAHLLAIIDVVIWQVWRCDEALAALGHRDVLDQLYPQCAVVDRDLGNVHVTVHAAVNEYPLGFASSVRATFGMALWIATVIHVIGVEIYVRKINFSSFLSPRDLFPQP